MKEIARIFTRLGLLGFGGPIATMAMMEEETSRRRGWISRERFAEMYAVCKILPGPVATQMAIYIGYEREGVAGGLLSGGLFILPSFLLVLVLSFFYLHSGVVQRSAPVFTGMQAAALVVILLSTYQLSKPYRKKPGAWAVMAASAAVVFHMPSWEPIVILLCGMSGALSKTMARRPNVARSATPVLVAGGAASWLHHAARSLHAKLFWVCFKAGAFVFGTGLAIVPVLEGDVVQKHHWLTHSQFMDGLAIGQITPGPVVITSTFIGYQTAGLTGALAATAGMFFPAFVNVLFLVPRIWKRFSGTPGAQGFSEWAIPAVVGGILGTTIRLGWLTLTTPLAGMIFVAAFAVALWLKPPAWLLIPLAGAAGAIGLFF